MVPPVSRPAMPLKCASLMFVLLSGCGTEREHDPESTPSARFEERVRAAEDELDPPPSASWPDDVETLAASVERFESIPACLAELRARTPTAVAEGVADMRYDAFFDDVCRGLSALAADDPTACDEIAVSTARAGCRRRYAIVAGDPDACPDDSVMPGRDPVCLAWASRNPELCRAAARASTTRCRAVLARDEDACRSLRGGDEARCRAEARRYRDVLPGGAVERAPIDDPELTADLTVDDGEPTTIRREVLGRGVFLEASGCSYHVALAEPLGELAFPTGPGRFESRIALDLRVDPSAARPTSLPMGADVAIVRVALPSIGGATSLSGGRGIVTVDAFGQALGDAIAGTIDGELRAGSRRVRVRGRFSTFVRDREPLPPACESATTPAP